MGTENQIHKTIALFYLFYDGVFLHHAAAQSDFQTGVSAFTAMQHTQPAIDSLIYIVSDCAGIIDDKICFLFLSPLVSRFF